MKCIVSKLLLFFFCFLFPFFSCCMEDKKELKSILKKQSSISMKKKRVIFPVHGSDRVGPGWSSNAILEIYSGKSPKTLYEEGYSKNHIDRAIENFSEAEKLFEVLLFGKERPELNGLNEEAIEAGYKLLLRVNDKVINILLPQNCRMYKKLSKKTEQKIDSVAFQVKTILETSDKYNCSFLAIVLAEKIKKKNEEQKIMQEKKDKEEKEWKKLQSKLSFFCNVHSINSDEKENLLPKNPKFRLFNMNKKVLSWILTNLCCICQDDSVLV